MTGPHRFKLFAKLQAETKGIQKSFTSRTNECKNSREFSRNLIGVNNEKEPLSGTTPESWLLDKSLHLKNKMR